MHLPAAQADTLPVVDEFPVRDPWVVDDDLEVPAVLGMPGDVITDDVRDHRVGELGEVGGEDLDDRAGVRFGVHPRIRACSRRSWTLR